jgi:DNA replication protein DnaC
MSPAYEAKAVAGLEQLGLVVALAQLDLVSQQAAAESWSYSHFLGYLLEGELVERQRRSVALNLQFAGFPVIKRLSEFDFAAQPSLDPRLIEELATGRFLAEGRNVVFLGPPGVGKTHLATALGVITCELGHRVYFTSALEMARKLTKAMAENRLHREMTKLTHPKLLIVDEIGYLALDGPQSALVFQAISKRYEKGLSLVLTSNKSFVDWGHVFAGDLVLASAALDRLLHRCTVVNIRGDSYRLKERRQAGLPPLPSAAGREAGRDSSRERPASTGRPARNVTLQNEPEGH